MLNLIFRIFYATALSFIEMAAPFFSAKLRRRQHVWRGLVRSAGLLIAARPQEPVVWFHAASAGEFEQARAVIEHLRNSGNPLVIVVSFFSPSGYEVHKHYPLADAVVYLPLDSPFSVRYFLRQIRPDVAVIVRYELWYELLRQLRLRSVPVFLISATFPSRRLLAPVFREMLRATTAIYTANPAEAGKFRPFVSPLTALISASDTRFDRIISGVRDAASGEPVLPPDFFAPGDVVLVAGSTWPEDERLLAAALRGERFSHVRCILVPHEVTSGHLSAIREAFPDSVLLSEISDNQRQHHVIADSYGKLLRLYGCGGIAYVGGGFGAGVHSTAEPAGYGIPILCGPITGRSPDAQALQQAGGLFVVASVVELQVALKMLVFSAEKRAEAGNAARCYVEVGAGTSRLIAADILNEITQPEQNAGA